MPTSLIPITVIDQLGTGGVGYIWSICEGSHEEEWRHSIAPIPADKLAKAMQTTDDDLELLTQDGSVLPPSGELKPESNYSDDNEDPRDDSIYFEKEVRMTTTKVMVLDKLLYRMNVYSSIFICRLKQLFYGLCMKTLKTIM